mgnify:FL=1
MKKGLDVKKNIEDVIASSMNGSVDVSDRYHHNSSYTAAPSIIKNGILSISDLHKRGIVKISDKVLKLSEDIESHINGSEQISLSVVGLDDLYKNEEEYDPFKTDSVDFIVSNDVKAARSSTHYGNEFLVYSPIDNDKIKSVDVRLFEYLDELERLNGSSVKDMISLYESLREIAISLRDSKLNIPLREMSNGNNNSLDIEKISEMPKLILK